MLLGVAGHCKHLNEGSIMNIDLIWPCGDGEGGGGTEDETEHGSTSDRDAIDGTHHQVGLLSPNDQVLNIQQLEASTLNNTLPVTSNTLINDSNINQTAVVDTDDNIKCENHSTGELISENYQNDIGDYREQQQQQFSNSLSIFLNQSHAIEEGKPTGRNTCQSTIETETTLLLPNTTNTDNIVEADIEQPSRIITTVEGENQTSAPPLSLPLSPTLHQDNQDDPSVTFEDNNCTTSIEKNCFSGVMGVNGDGTTTTTNHHTDNQNSDPMINGLTTYAGCYPSQNNAGLQMHQPHQGTMATFIDQYQQQQIKNESEDSPGQKTPSPSQLDDNNNANGIGHIKNSAEALQLLRASTPQSPATISIQNQAAYKQTLEYLKQLFADRERLSMVPYGVFTHLSRLLEQEIQRVRTSLIHIDGSADQRPSLVLPEPDGTTVSQSTKIYMPVDKYPDHNFIGRIIGPRGLTIRELEADCGCKLYIRGKGSLRDRHKEEKLRTQANWEHLNDELHVLIMVEDTENRAKVKLERAVSEINKLLESVILNKDEFKMRQLAELAILNDKFKTQTNAAAVQAAVQAASGSAESAQSQAATFQMLTNAAAVAANTSSSGQSVVSQMSPISVMAANGNSISPQQHHLQQQQQHQYSGHHAAAVAQAQQQVAQQAAAAQHQAATAAAIQAALQTAALQSVSNHHAAITHAHHQQQQLHPSMALAAATQSANAYHLQAAAAAAANQQHQLNSFFNPGAYAQAALAQTGIETPQGILFTTGGLASPGSLYTADQINQLAAAVQFPVNNSGSNKRYHPYGKKKNN